MCRVKIAWTGCRTGFAISTGSAVCHLGLLFWLCAGSSGTSTRYRTSRTDNMQCRIELAPFTGWYWGRCVDVSRWCELWSVQNLRKCCTPGTGAVCQQNNGAAGYTAALMNLLLGLCCLVCSSMNWLYMKKDGIQWSVYWCWKSGR